jgi:periplasmic divalent cation tolerance protein
MDLRFVYITCKDADEARRIGKTLVEQRLAACANVLDGMNSFYWWEDALQDDREAVLIAKTRADLMEELTDLVCKLHSYDVPCVVGLPFGEGNPEYLAWVRAETKPS